MTVIKDGTGTSMLAKVCHQNMLATESVTIPNVAYASQVDANTYQVVGITTIAAVGTEKTVSVLINNGDRSIAISRILISIEGETDKPVQLRAFLGQRTYTSGGTAKTPVNLHVTSTNVSDTSFYYDNPVLGGTDSEFGYFVLESTTAIVIPIDGQIVLPQSASIRHTCEGATGAAGTKRCYVTYTWYYPMLLN